MNTGHGTSFYAIRDAFTGIRYDRVGHRVLQIPRVEGEGLTVAYYMVIKFAFLGCCRDWSVFRDGWFP